LLSSALLATAALFAGTAGPPIKSLPLCDDTYAIFEQGGDRERFRNSMLCLINGVRQAQGLPALTRDPKLERVAQAQSDRFARTGRVSHGKSITDINKRFARRGYRAAAYNEAFAIIPGAVPYAFLDDMTKARRVPCTQLFDPRMKDIGIGMSLAPVGATLTLEFGLKVGQKQPSTNFRPQATCPHRVPAPVITEPAVRLADYPTATPAGGVVASLVCTATSACTFSVSVTLKTADATSPSQTLTIPAGTSQTVTFPFDPPTMQAELGGPKPQVVFNFSVTAPAEYTQQVGSALLAA
jgi:uncharacterized protein YkwD